jgi:hypothetical protein
MLLVVRRLLLAVCITGCSSGDAPESLSRHPLLSLVEVRSIPLPAGSLVRGASLSLHGDVLYWSDSSVIMVPNDGTSNAVHLCRGQLFQPVSAAFAAQDTLVEIVDAGYRSVYRSARGGSCTRQLLPIYAKHVADAVRDDTGWLLLLNSTERKGQVIRLRYGVEPSQLFEFVQDSATPTDLTSTYFGVADGRLIGATINWPFTWILQDTLGIVQLRASALGVESSPGESIRDWVGLRVVALDKGFIQTVADPRSDARAMLLYDSAGRLIRQTRLKLPIGVLAAVPTQRQLLALRTTDRVELVVYQWAWQSPSLNRT